MKKLRERLNQGNKLVRVTRMRRLREILTSHCQAEEHKQRPVTGGHHSRGQETSLRASRICVYREPGSDHEEGAEPCRHIDLHHGHLLHFAHPEVGRNTVITQHTLFFI